MQIKCFKDIAGAVKIIGHARYWFCPEDSSDPAKAKPVWLNPETTTLRVAAKIFSSAACIFGTIKFLDNSQILYWGRIANTLGRIPAVGRLFLFPLGVIKDFFEIISSVLGLIADYKKIHSQKKKSRLESSKAAKWIQRRSLIESSEGRKSLAKEYQEKVNITTRSLNQDLLAPTPRIETKKASHACLEDNLPVQRKDNFNDGSPGLAVQTHSAKNGLAASNLSKISLWKDYVKSLDEYSEQNNRLFRSFLLSKYDFKIDLWKSEELNSRNDKIITRLSIIHRAGQFTLAILGIALLTGIGSLGAFAIVGIATYTIGYSKVLRKKKHPPIDISEKKATQTKKLKAILDQKKADKVIPLAIEAPPPPVLPSPILPPEPIETPPVPSVLSEPAPNLSEPAPIGGPIAISGEEDLSNFASDPSPTPAPVKPTPLGKLPNAEEIIYGEERGDNSPPPEQLLLLHDTPLKRDTPPKLISPMRKDFPSFPYADYTGEVPGQSNDSESTPIPPAPLSVKEIWESSMNSPTSKPLEKNRLENSVPAINLINLASERDRSWPQT